MRIETSARPARPIAGARGLPDALAPIGLFAGSPELIGSPFSYSREEEIYGEGEEADFVYKIVSGAVRTYKLIGDGRRQINGFYLPGDLFGFERGDMHRLTAEAIVDTKVIMFRRRQLERLATTDVDVACQLWSMTAKSLQHAEAHMLLLGRRTALERVATFLMEMDSRLGHTGSIELSMSRRDIADYLGLTLETVSRFDVPAAEPTCGRTCGSAPPRSRQRDDEDAGRRLMDSAPERSGACCVYSSVFKYSIRSPICPGSKRHSGMDGWPVLIPSANASARSSTG